MNSRKDIQVLIPTYNRLKALAVTLTGLCYQTEKSFEIVISDQSPEDTIKEDATIQTIIRILEMHGNGVSIIKNLPQRGMAQQRQFLLEQSTSPYSLFLDDDLVIEPYVLKNMKQSLQKYRCGFVGSAVIGLSYRDDHRPHQQQIELWGNEVQPETITPEGPLWHRHTLHNAANILHVQQQLNASPDAPRPYKVAWVGGCVMYDTIKLLATGGFQFWKELPLQHCGEDVLAQIRVMKKYGGCGIIPTGVYHQEIETSIMDRKVNAPEFLEI